MGARVAPTTGMLDQMMGNGPNMPCLLQKPRVGNSQASTPLSGDVLRAFDTYNRDLEAAAAGLTPVCSNRSFCTQTFIKPQNSLVWQFARPPTVVVVAVGFRLQGGRQKVRPVLFWGRRVSSTRVSGPMKRNTTSSVTCLTCRPVYECFRTCLCRLFLCSSVIRGAAVKKEIGQLSNLVIDMSQAENPDLLKQLKGHEAKMKAFSLKPLVYRLNKPDH